MVFHNTISMQLDKAARKLAGFIEEGIIVENGEAARKRERRLAQAATQKVQNRKRVHQQTSTPGKVL